MQAVILVHGIMGSKLKLGTEVIWPPSLGEILQDQYTRIGKLRDPRAVPTDLLYQYTGFYQIYGPIARELDAILAQQGGRRPNFWFDWRVDLLKSADVLAQAIADTCSGPNPANEVAIVAHSMGGLVARLLLESGKYNGAIWFQNIKKFVAVCVPQVGAPLAVARAVGQQGSTTISPEDMKLMMNDANFPAGFELFPAPPYRNSALFDINNGPWDIYAANTAAKFQLSTQNQAAALNSWSMLDFGKRPANVQYISIAANGHSTENAFYFNNTGYVSSVSVDGDGTVPYWSSSYGPVDRLYTLPGDHIAVMNTNAFRRILHEIFDSGISAMAFVADKPGITISLNKRDLQAGETMEVLLIPDARTTGLTGKLRIHKASDAAGAGLSLASIGADVPITYEGPPVASLPVVIHAPAAPGVYVITFEGTHSSAEETSAGFFVTRKPTPTFAAPPLQEAKPSAKTSKASKPTKARRPRKGK